MEPATFITGNPSKAEQLGRYLHAPIAHQKVDLVEIQSLDLYEIIKYKTQEAYKVVGGPVLVEDVSLRFHALGNLPGPLIKWFLQELHLEGLARLLDGYEDRSATAEVLFGLYDGQTLQTFHGSRLGSIATHPRGDRSFGWNDVFQPEGYTKTWGEMNQEEQAQTSMRKIALQQLQTVLQVK